MNWKNLMLVGAVIAAVSFAEAKTAYVSSDGNDSTGEVDNPDLPFATLKTALTKLTTGDVLQLKDGTLTLTEQFTLNRAVTLQGNPNDRRAVVINVNSTSENPYRGIYMNTTGACVRDLTVSNAFDSTTTASGIGVSIVADGAAISNCVITCCRTTGASGAAAAVCLTAKKKVDNVQVDGECEAYGCEFSHNFAANRGGAVFTNGYGDRVIDCDFIDNEASGPGGGAMGFDGVYIGCTFLNNRAAGKGGALVISGASTRGRNAGAVSNCVFRGNFSGTGGSAFAGVAQAGGFYKCVFADGMVSNATLAAGGGAVLLDVDFTTNRFVDCVFTNNTMYGGFGSAVCVFPGNGKTGTVVELENCEVVDNREIPHPTKAEGWCDGGAVALSTQNNRLGLYANACRFVRNSGRSAGGGILFYGNAFRLPSEIRNCLFEGNSIGGRSPHIGGAIAACSPLDIVNCTIITNYAGSNGGGIFMGGVNGTADYGRAKVYNTVLVGNTIGAGTANDFGVDKNTTVGADEVVNCAMAVDVGGTDNVPISPSDSLFTDAANGDYTLAKDSVLINKGVNFDWMVGASDIRGNARKFPRIRKDGVNIVDIGCYEYRPTLGLMLLLR